MNGRTRSRAMMTLLSIAGVLALLAMISPVAAQVDDEAEPACDAALEAEADPDAVGCEETPEPEPSEEPAPDPEPSEEPAPDPVDEVEPPADEAQPTQPEADAPPDPSPPSGGGGDHESAKPSSPGSKETPSEGGEGRAHLQASGAPDGGPEPASAPFVYLGGQGTTEGLIELLEPVVERGTPLEKALLRVGGPFPVAGLSWWTNDWHAPRCCPDPHLHKGLDMFAEEGTPLVAIADGIVTQKRIGAVSGLSVEIRDADGVEYFYAHLSDFAEELEAGQEVSVGDVIGYVGDTGNAKGTMPHLHLEVQPNGVSVPPIPYVEEWLEMAERKAARWVERLTGEAPALPVHATAPAVTAQLLEHPSIPTGGAVPASVEALDRLASMGMTMLRRDPSSGFVALAPVARQAPGSWPAGGSFRVEALSFGLLLAVALVALLIGWARRPARRSRRRLPASVPRELELPVVAVPMDPPQRPEEVTEPEAGRGRERELVGAGSTTLLLLAGLLLLMGLRTRR